MRNGILKSMGMDDVPRGEEFDVGCGFETTFEPNAETFARLRAEHAARVAAGDMEARQINLTDAEMDCVVYAVFLAQRKGGVMLAGGMIPQARIRGPEVARIPKVELFGRIDQAFSGMKG
jgi:hypothetical protein